MNGFKSFLSAAGHDFLAVFSWIGSKRGQAAINGTEAVLNTVVAAYNPVLGASLVGVESLVNAGLKQALSMEASAAAVGAQSGTGAQKSAAVIATLAPQTAAFLQSIGIAEPTVEQSQTLAKAISDSLVAILNAIPAPAEARPAKEA